MKKVVPLLLALIALPLFPAARATTELGADAKEAAQDVKKTSRKGMRKVKDKTCELVNGKMECAAKKLKHGVENTADEVKDKLN